MKKLISTIILLSMAAGLCFAAPKKGKEKEKSTGIKLDPKKKYAIEGIALGSDNWPQVELSNKGEIIWNQNQGDFQQIGWELRGTDLSKYAGLRFELAAGQKFEEYHVWLENPASTGDWSFNFFNDGVAYVMFNGVNKAWGDMKNPDIEEGFLMKIGGNVKQFKKTVIKSIELIKKEELPDASNLTILGVPFGTSIWQSHVLGNEVIWVNGDKSGDAGWDLSGVDLSEYDRVRVEFESCTTKNFGLRLCDSNHDHWHGFDQRVEPNVIEADLTGEGASWGNENGNFDKSQGLKIIIQTWDRTKEEKMVVKSIQLLKGKKIVNENLMIEDRMFGSCGWWTNVYDGGRIDWDWNDGKEHYPCAGWYVKDIDFSAYTKLRVELDPSTPATNLTIGLYQGDNDVTTQFDAVSPTILEANLDGSYFDARWENKGKWDPSKKIDQIWIRYDDLQTSGEKSIVKSITLLDEEVVAPQPENIMLNDNKFGSAKANAKVDSNYVINWKKGNYAMCGWHYDDLKGDILEIKITSTEYPLRLRIRDFGSKNEASWDDDGTHVFRINLKNKKSINEKGGEKPADWQKSSSAFVYEAGGEIVLEPINGVFKDGKQTVVEYIKVE